MTSIKRLSLSIVLMLLAFSCQILDQEENPTKKSELTTESAKAWFESYVKKEPIAEPGALSESTASIQKFVLWQLAKKVEVFGTAVLIVPVWYEQKYQLKGRAIRQLRVYKDENGNYKADIMEFLASDDYIKKNSEISFRNFSGSITVHDWHEGFRFGMQIEGGSKTGYIEGYTLNPTSQRTSIDARTSDCGYQTSQWYYDPNCVGCLPTIEIQWNTVPCSFIYTNGYYYYQGTNYQDYSAWFDYNYSCDYNAHPWCPPQLQDLANACTNSACLAIEQAIYEQQAQDNFNYNRINDSQLPYCLQMVVSGLRSLTNGSVADVVQKLSGEAPGWNWELRTGPIQPPTGPGQTNPAGYYNHATGTITTTFDLQAWPDATDLSWARTMLHESIHAYMAIFYATDQSGFIDSYPQMVQDWGTYRNWNAVQHEEFARSLVKSIADALQEYGTASGRNLTRQFYEDMSWAGLHETTTFQNLPAAEKARILNTIAIEATGKDLAGNIVAQKGIDIGC